MEHENDDWARKRAEIVKLIKEGATPDNRDASAFGVLALLAPLDEIRLKLIAGIFTAMSPFAQECVTKPPPRRRPRRRRSNNVVALKLADRPKAL